MKKIAFVLLAGLMACTAAACKKDKNNGGTAAGPTDGTTYSDDLVYDGGLHEISVGETDYPLLANGESEYKVVIPAAADENETLAANELTGFFSTATGCSLPIVTDDAAEYNADAKYIFVGETVQSDTEMPVDFGLVGADGYKIETKNRSVFIRGGASLGTVFGVYFFLNRTVGYKVYCGDEIQTGSYTDLKLPDFEVTDKPDFAYREANYGELLQDKTVRTRLRFDTTATMYLFGHNCHNSFTVMPKQKYATEHPDWYSKTGGQLCYSNEGMIEEYIVNMKAQLESLGLDRVVFMGQEDNHDWCTCDDCRASRERYGTDSAVMIKFANRVSREINAWREETYPDSDPIRFIVFAYYATNDAPVNYDEATDTFSLMKDEEGNDLRFDDNVGIMYAAPMDYHLTFQDAPNANYYKQLRAWSHVTNIIHYWGYPLYTWEYMVPFDMYSSIKTNFVTLLDNNASSLLEQTKFSQTRSPGFARLHNYLETELMWNVNQNVESLISEFFREYFKDAATGVRKYFDEMRAWYDHLYLTTDAREGKSWGWQLVKTEYWPQNLLEKWLGYFAEAKAAIAHLEQADPGLYDKLYDRVELEEMSVRYILLQLYRNNYPSDERMRMMLEFYEDFNRLKIGNVTEQAAGASQTVPMSKFWESWGLA